MKHIALGVNIGNLSRGKTQREPMLARCAAIRSRSEAVSRIVFYCRTANDPAMINKEKTNENNTDVDRWADARRLRINGKPCS